jgi:hypothetical protein
VAILGNFSIRWQDIHHHAANKFTELFITSIEKFNPNSPNDEEFSGIDQPTALSLVDNFHNLLCTDRLKHNTPILCSVLRNQTLHLLFNKVRDDPEFSISTTQLNELFQHFQHSLSSGDRWTLQSQKSYNLTPKLRDEVAKYLKSKNALVAGLNRDSLYTSDEQTSRELTHSYVWSLIFVNSLIIWDKDSVRLFDVNFWVPQTLLDSYSGLDEMYGASETQSDTQAAATHEEPVPVQETQTHSVVVPPTSSTKKHRGKV